MADESPDLSHVIFEAPAQLAPDAPSGENLSLYEWDHGALRFVGILPNGSAAPSSIAGLGATAFFYTFHTMSQDGSKIFFTVPDVSGTQGDIYMRLDHQTTVQVNASVRTHPAAPRHDAIYQVASADGSKVLFTSTDALTDQTGGNLYVYDTTLPPSDPNRLQHVYVDQQPDDGVGSATQGVLGISDDGSYIYFFDENALLPNQALLPSEAPLGLYVWHNGTVSFIGSVDDLAAHTDAFPHDTRTQVATRLSPDGRTLLFLAHSGTGLAPHYDHGSCADGSSSRSCSELYLYRADTGSVTCVSCNPTGAAATSDADVRIRTGVGAARTTSHLNQPLTGDANHVFFTTGERLLPDEDVNGKATDVYEWTAAGTDGCGPSSPGYAASSSGCLALITSGRGPDDSYFLDATPSGHDVFFTTDERLLRWDTDNAYDLYDARIGGGFPEPTVSKPECTGETCQGTIVHPPGATPPKSSTFFDSEHRPAAKHRVKHCRRGRVRKRVHGRVRCVKRHARAHRSRRR